MENELKQNTKIVYLLSLTHRNNRYRDTGRREYRDRNDDYRERSPPPYHSG